MCHELGHPEFSVVNHHLHILSCSIRLKRDFSPSLGTGTFSTVKDVVDDEILRHRVMKLAHHYSEVRHVHADTGCMTAIA